jgi:nucleotide-binding universal stress UspA family protein
MKKILLPTDFSPASMAAYKFAVEYAALTKGEVIVVHVIDIPVIQETTFGLQPYLYAQEMYREAVENSHRIYERMKMIYPSNVPVSFRPLNDDLIGGLAEFIRINYIDLVIMSTRGASELEEFVSGSQTKRIARYSPVPVLAIPHELSPSSIRNIVFPNSLEPAQEHLIAAITEFQRELQAQLHLLFVNTPVNTHSEDECRKLLKDFALYYQLENYTINYRYDTSERAGIKRFTDEIGADMIAMGTHGRKGLAHFLKGSIAESVIGKVERPILISKLL